MKNLITKAFLILVALCCAVVSITVLIGRFVPEGWQIAYSDWDNEGWHIYVYDIDRQLHTQVYTDALSPNEMQDETVYNYFDSPLSVAPNQQYFIRRHHDNINGTQAFLVTMDGEQAHLIRFLRIALDPRLSIPTITWSPDSQHVAYQMNQTIYVITINRNSVPDEPVAVSDSLIAFNPAWSADSTQLVFQGQETSVGLPDIYVVAPDGNNLRNVTQSPEIWDGNPSWSHDGARLIFTSGRGGMNIFSIDLDGTEAQQLTDNHTPEDYAVMSPDNSMIAYQALQPTMNLFISPALPESQPRGPIVNGIVNRAVIWSTDSKHLLVLGQSNIGFLPYLVDAVQNTVQLLPLNGTVLLP